MICLWNQRQYGILNYIAGAPHACRQFMPTGIKTVPIMAAAGDYVNLQHTHLLYDENRHFAIENLPKKLILEVITHKKHIPK